MPINILQTIKFKNKNVCKILETNIIISLTSKWLPLQMSKSKAYIIRILLSVNSN